MSHSWWLPNIKKRPLFTGLPNQIKDWSESFQIRKDNVGWYYIAWKNTFNKVENSIINNDFSIVKEYLKENWKRFLDEEFERQVLLGSEQSSTDDSTEN